MFKIKKDKKNKYIRCSYIRRAQPPTKDNNNLFGGNKHVFLNLCDTLIVLLSLATEQPMT